MAISYAGTQLDLTQRFPDGTYAFHVIPHPGPAPCQIVWRYEGDHELFALYLLVNHLREQGAQCLRLVMPYVPNARMDRVKAANEVFTLKHFAQFINDLRFDAVVILDPHSNVAPALLNNVIVKTPEYYVEQALDHIKTRKLRIYYPDEGAMKRYIDMRFHGSALRYTFGIKQRDWLTGKILSTEVAHPEVVKDCDVLIIDDICSRGGTFYHSAKALKAAGAKDIYLFVTHCENTILQGEMINDDDVKHIFCTDSIFTGEHDKITVLS